MAEESEKSMVAVGNKIAKVLRDIYDELRNIRRVLEEEEDDDDDDDD